MPRLLRLIGTAAIPTALAIALVGVPAVAAVEPAPTPTPASAALTLDPVPGGLAAFGHGSARIHIPQDGNVTGKMTLGRLRVRGADAVIVEAYASRETLKDGSVLYRGVRGPFSSPAARSPCGSPATTCASPRPATASRFSGATASSAWTAALFAAGPSAASTCASEPRVAPAAPRRHPLSRSLVSSTDDPLIRKRVAFTLAGRSAVRALASRPIQHA